jgi:hypothetical protein
MQIADKMTNFKVERHNVHGRGSCIALALATAPTPPRQVSVSNCNTKSVLNLELK